MPEWRLHFKPEILAIMIGITSPRALVFSAIIASVLPACSVYKKCGLDGCAGDAQITAEVRALFNQHAVLEPPNLIGIQTLDHVVFLTGLVDTDFERRIALSVALEASGVTRVVNSIEVRNDGARR
jgi:osmotically-inducible protein OsmY